MCWTISRKPRTHPATTALHCLLHLSCCLKPQHLCLQSLFPTNHSKLVWTTHPHSRIIYDRLELILHGHFAVMGTATYSVSSSFNYVHCSLRRLSFHCYIFINIYLFYLPRFHLSLSSIRAGDGANPQNGYDAVNLPDTSSSNFSRCTRRRRQWFRHPFSAFFPVKNLPEDPQSVIPQMCK